MTDAVALIPGFLGFDHLRDETYFADRFVAALRASLLAISGRDATIIPLGTLPMGSLAQRQAVLLETLRKLDAKLGPTRWHLIGHSSGGLDAAMLGRTQRLVQEGSEPSRFSADPLDDLPNLASIVTLCTPHHGTCLVLSSAVQLAVWRRPSLLGAAELAEGIGALTQWSTIEGRLRFGYGALREGKTVPFLGHLLFADALARDVTPQVASALTRTDNRRPQTRVMSFVTVAPTPAAAVTDRLFRVLWRWTAERAPDSDVPRPPPFPAFEPAKVIASAPGLIALPPSPELSDGIINADRQVDGELAGVVVGDHADVLGDYRRTDLIDGTDLNPGLLTSGANFRDPQFFALIARIAGCIASAMK